MQRGKAFLHVRAFAHLRCAAEEYADLTLTHVFEERGFRRVLVKVLDKGDVAVRDAARDQLLAHIGID